MDIFIDNRQDKIEIDDKIEALLTKIVEESLLVERNDTDYEVSISFVDNEEIRELNRDYRDIDRETDVLSFPIEDDFPMALPLLGDIIISTEKAIEQAADFNHSVEREISYLTVHSMFHLMGYDHLNEEDKKIMREKEDKVLNNLGITRDFKGEDFYDKGLDR